MFSAGCTATLTSLNTPSPSLSNPWSDVFPHAPIGKNLEISCLKIYLAIPVERALVPGLGQITTIIGEGVHAFRRGISNGSWVDVFAVANQAIALGSA